MPDMIRDGTGDGYLAKIDDDNRLWIVGSQFDNSFFINLFKQESYTTSFGNITATTGGNCIGYIKNTSDTKELVIVRVRHRCTTTNTTMTIKLKDAGTPGGTTTITPVNRNTNSNKTAVGDFYKGTNITGLSGGSTVASIYSVASQPWEDWCPCSNLIIGTNQVCTFYVDNNTAANWIGVGLYYREVE